MLENARVIAAISLVKYICDPDATKHALVYLNAKSKGDLLLKNSDGDIMSGIQKLNDTVNHILEMPEKVQMNAFLQLLLAIDDSDEVYQPVSYTHLDVYKRQAVWRWFQLLATW